MHGGAQIGVSACGYGKSGPKPQVVDSSDFAPIRSVCQNTFSLNYYRKRPELLRPVAKGLVAGSAHRQLARSLDCAPSTVTLISARLGRHAMLLMLRALLALKGQVIESIVFDHFEIFELTQDLPLGVGTPVRAESWFVYGAETPLGTLAPGSVREPRRDAESDERSDWRVVATSARHGAF
jgi:hypothetical protein